VEQLEQQLEVQSAQVQQMQQREAQMQQQLQQMGGLLQVEVGPLACLGALLPAHPRPGASEGGERQS
jgi:hypothetical protein